ncbi:Methyltransferase domain-containing protein [Frankineae bacterium MT45]|nr:Methyltransferase domain-containing protein [Frankineae bacterium MT45]
MTTAAESADQSTDEFTEELAGKPNPHASEAEIEAAWSDPKLANILYHDWEAGTYDEKWSISFDERCIDYARDRFAHIAGEGGWPYGKALELGCGTGFFLLNLKLAGVIEEGHVTDLSPGMVEVAQRNARSLGFEVQGRVADAERLPYPDDTFDLVVGHAVLHHIPDLDLAFGEILRVLKPGGRFVFAGEPTKWGDKIARRLSRATWWAATHATRLPALASWRRPQEELDESSRAAALEAVVDIHTFIPDELAAHALRAGARSVRTRTDELTAAWFGWPVRTFECAVPREKLGFRWANFAMKGWQRLSALDAVLAYVVPKGLFYNVEITGVKADPAGTTGKASPTPSS